MPWDLVRRHSSVDLADKTLTVYVHASGRILHKSSIYSTKLIVFLGTKIWVIKINLESFKIFRGLLCCTQITKIHSFCKQLCTYKDLLFIKWHRMSALAILKMFVKEDPVFMNWRSCRHSLQNKWPLGDFFDMIQTNGFSLSLITAIWQNLQLDFDSLDLKRKLKQISNDCMALWQIS